MSRARGHSLDRGFCLCLASWCVCLGCSAPFTSNEGGSGGSGASGSGAGGADGGTNSAPTAGRGGDHAAAGEPSSGGTHAGTGGNAHGGSGGTAKGGAANGGRGGSSGANGHGGAGATGQGGKGTCEIMECFVENTCLDKCGGNVVYTGCCACEPPSVNKLTCTGTP